MSRVGKLPITIPAGVSLDVSDESVRVKGPKGDLTQRIVAGTSIDVDGAVATVSRANETRQVLANHGLMRSLLNNMVVGVSEGFSKTLEIQGIGYRADMKGSNLEMQLGYSHPIRYPVPAGVDVSVDGGTTIVVKGADKQQVGQVAAVIRGFRKPDRYKGKGVRYQGEHVRLKQGKSA